MGVAYKVSQIYDAGMKAGGFQRNGLEKRLQADRQTLPI